MNALQLAYQIAPRVEAGEEYGVLFRPASGRGMGHLVLSSAGDAEPSARLPRIVAIADADQLVELYRTTHGDSGHLESVEPMATVLLK